MLCQQALGVKSLSLSKVHQLFGFSKSETLLRARAGLVKEPGVDAHSLRTSAEALHATVGCKREEERESCLSSLPMLAQAQCHQIAPLALTNASAFPLCLPHQTRRCPQCGEPASQSEIHALLHAIMHDLKEMSMLRYAPSPPSSLHGAHSKETIC